MAICSSSDQLGLSLIRQAARLHAAGGPDVAQALSSYIGQLPPLGPSAAVSNLTPGIVEAFAALYYYGELEEASLIALAELIVEERFTLNITDRSLFQSLEDMATLIDQAWYGQERRNAIFTQMLGLGSGNDIRNPLQTVANSLTQYEQSLRYGMLSHREVAATEFAFSSMLNAMAARGGLGLERAAQVLNGQLRAALAVLGNSALHNMFHVQDLWGFVRSIAVTPFGQQPDTTAIVDRAQAGAAIIGWSAGRLEEITARNGSLRAVLANESLLFRNAARWNMGARSLPGQSTSDATGSGNYGDLPPAGSPWGNTGNQRGGWA